jgi:NADH-quinone oxidoreductase subunit A
MQDSSFPILLFFTGGLLFIGLGLGFSLLLQKQNPTPEKLLNYECGEDPVMIRSRFNLRFFLAAVVFVLMEVELVLMAPVLLNRNGIAGISSGESSALLKTGVLIFLGILGAGLLLALGLRYFDWHKPAAAVPNFQGPVPDFVYEQYNLNKEQRSGQGR